MHTRVESTARAESGDSPGPGSPAPVRDRIRAVTEKDRGRHLLRPRPHRADKGAFQAPPYAAIPMTCASFRLNSTSRTPTAIGIIDTPMKYMTSLPGV